MEIEIASWLTDIKQAISEINEFVQPFRWVRHRKDKKRI